MQRELTLTGLDGTNPLAFLAALGTLEAVSNADPEGRMAWKYLGTWCPVLYSGLSTVDDVVQVLDDDRRSCERDPALSLEYEGKADLKPPRGIYRKFLLALLEHAAPSSRRSVDWAAAFATDVAVDNNGNTKPTALHFTAGQQQFLLMARELVRHVTRQDFQEALQGPWRYTRPLPVMGWDSTASRDYALRATDPSTDKKHGVPGVDWLALRGLIALPTAPRGNQVLTTGCTGAWKDGHFGWPLWTVPLSAQVVRSLLSMDVRSISSFERQALGIGAAFSAAISRHPNGGRGSFRPAAPV